jgi:hypothetical protein
VGEEDFLRGKKTTLDRDPASGKRSRKWKPFRQVMFIEE